MVALSDIERFLGETGMPWSTFGWLAVRDKRLVGDMRNGRSLRPETAQRIAVFMEQCR